MPGWYALPIWAIHPRFRTRRASTPRCWQAWRARPQLVPFDGRHRRNELGPCGLARRASGARPTILLDQIAHKTAVRFNRRILRPMLGPLLPEWSYESIRTAFRPTNVTA